MAGVKNRIVMPYEENHRTLKDGTIEKKCNRCNKWFPCTDEYFYRNGNKIDGLFTFCKQCNIKKTKQWEEEHFEEYMEYQRNRARMPHVKQRFKEYFKKYFANNEEHRKEYMHDYRTNNKDKVKSYNEKYQHKKHDITEKEWESCKKYFDYKCAYCGIAEEEAKEKYDQNLHKEHFDHDGASDLSNCLPACKGCNSSKWEYSFESWYNENNHRFDDNRLLKIFQWLTRDYELYME